MSIFKRVKLDQEGAQNPAVSADSPQSLADVTTIHISGLQKPKKQIDVTQALYDALDKFGVKPKFYGHEWARIPAVWRGSRDANISVNLKSGATTDFAGGTGRMTFDELMDLLQHTPGDVSLTKNSSDEVQNSIIQRTKDALSMWKKGVTLEGSSNAAKVGRIYFEETRGIPKDTMAGIYSKVRAVQGDYGGVTVLLPIYQPEANNRLIGIQRVFLTAEGKKYIDRPKAMLGSHFSGNNAGGFLITGDKNRFSKHEIAIVEGFETGLAVSASTGMPVYVLYNSNGIKRASLEYLSALGVQAVLIAADNDDPDKYNKRAGQDASQHLAERIAKESGAPVRIALPPRKYTEGKPCDWLDIWGKDPAATGRLILSATEFKVEEAPPPQLRGAMRSIFKR